jgi:uncharacterized caspase-like protein
MGYIIRRKNQQGVKRMTKLWYSVLLFLSISLLLPTYAMPDVIVSPVTSGHLLMIESLFSDNGLQDASVALDRYGRVELKGSYKNTREVSLAFSLAQSVVGVKWVSPVTPENIKIRQWAEGLAALFPKAKQEHKARVPKDDETLNNNSPQKYALIVGVSEFQNRDIYKLKTGLELNLKYAARDAKEVYTFLTDPAGGDFRTNNVQLLLNSEATKRNIIKALAGMAERVRPSDTVFLYFSSHGTPSKYDGSMDIVTYDTDVKSSLTAWDTAFSAKELKDFISEVNVARLVVVLDVCFSGRAFKNINGFYYAGSRMDFDNDNQGISKATMAKSLMGAKDIVFEDDNVNVTKSTRGEGTKVLISASDAGEKSWESDALKDSFFTYYFIHGLKRYSRIEDAFNYSKPKVIQRVKEEKDQPQHPQAVTNKKDWNIAIAAQ